MSDCKFLEFSFDKIKFLNLIPYTQLRGIWIIFSESRKYYSEEFFDSSLFYILLKFGLKQIHLATYWSPQMMGGSFMAKQGIFLHFPTFTSSAYFVPSFTNLLIFHHFSGFNQEHQFGYQYLGDLDTVSAIDLHCVGN